MSEPRIVVREYPGADPGPERFSPAARAAALCVYGAVWAYALLVPLLGARAGRVLYAAFMPVVHNVLGYSLFVPFTEIMERRGLKIALTAVVVFGLLSGARALLRRARGLHADALARAISASLLAYGLFLAFLCMCETVVAGTFTAPLYLYAALLWVLLYTLPAPRGRLGLARPLMLACAAFLLALGLFGRVPVKYMVLMLGILYGAGVALWRGAGPRRWGLAGHPLAMMLFCACCGLGAVGSFWKAPVACSAPHMRAAGAILIPGTDRRPYDAIVPPGQRKLFVAYKRGALEQIDLDSMKSDALEDLRARGMRGSTQRLIFNPQTRQIYTTFWRAQDNGAVAVFNTAPLSLDRIVSEPHCPAISLQLDPLTSQLIVLCESGRRLVWFDTRDWRKTGEVRFPILTQPHTARLDASRRRIFVCSGAMSHFLYEVHADKRRILRRANIGFVTLGMDIDTRTQRAYLAKPYHNKVLIVDLAAMRTAGSLDTEPGPRDLEIDSGRSRLYVGNYIAGTVQEFDLEQGRAVRAWPLAKQVRGVCRSADLNRLFAATACGVAELKQEPARSRAARGN